MNQEIINKAIQGGYEYDEAHHNHTGDGCLILDPKFFQAIGKALGWEDTYKGWICGKKECTDIWQYPDERWLQKTCSKGHQTFESDITYKVKDTEWYQHAHEYFDLLLTSGDTEKFWKELIK